MQTLFKQQSEEIFIGHEFSCVVISNICVSSPFYDSFYDVSDTEASFLDLHLSISDGFL